MKRCAITATVVDICHEVSEPGSPMPLGAAAMAGNAADPFGARIAAIRTNPIPRRWLLSYGAETPVPEWRKRLVCSRCDGRAVDMVVTGTK
jgi:hypothetical protein